MSRRPLLCACFFVAAITVAPIGSYADKNGVSVWLPGSLAAVPLEPGWSFGKVYYHTAVSGGARAATGREISIGRLYSHFAAVGYVYEQPTAGGGAAELLDGLKPGVVAAGPQVGYLTPIASRNTYVNIKSYGEFDAVTRPSGRNMWLKVSAIF
jgi:hypothetical protein